VKPIVGALVNVEPASNLDTPAVTQIDLTVMQARIGADCELDIELFEAVGNRMELGLEKLKISILEGGGSPPKTQAATDQRRDMKRHHLYALMESMEI
jgi:hypothetical protein